MTARMDMGRTMGRLGPLLRTGVPSPARESTSDPWLVASKQVSRVGGSRVLILTDELKETGYDYGDDVTVMILRRGYDPSAEIIPLMMEDD